MVKTSYKEYCVGCETCRGSGCVNYRAKLWKCDRCGDDACCRMDTDEGEKDLCEQCRNEELEYKFFDLSDKEKADLLGLSYSEQRPEE